MNGQKIYFFGYVSELLAECPSLSLVMNRLPLEAFYLGLRVMLMLSCQISNVCTCLDLPNSQGTPHPPALLVALVLSIGLLYFTNDTMIGKENIDCIFYFEYSDINKKNFRFQP